MPQPNRFVTARLSFRKGTTQEWKDHDPILIQGEPSVDTTLNKFKIGNGVDSWSQLPYIESLGGAGEWTNDLSGLYPEFITNQKEAIDYVKYHHDLLEDNANAYFEAGINQDTFSQLFELSVTANTGGAASITGASRKYNTYSDGDQVEISAVAFNPKTFSGWTGLLSGEVDTATTTITISSTRNLIANFS